MFILIIKFLKRVEQSPFNAIVIEGAVTQIPEDILSQLDEAEDLLALYQMAIFAMLKSSQRMEPLT